ncbi:PaaI family thioesterase [Haladaptatus halobius]|uniref:PaaI family thioesterase n=1 Tax=Haladaptatus halobius TaxID=2884875 RepID=UPI001D0AC12A|nr:PaaI family thioesterase [Haladaptatus halobius]
MYNDSTASERVLDRTEFLSWLDISIDVEDEGSAEIRLPHAEKLTNPDGDVIHGGIIASFIDNASGTALRSVLENPNTATYATTDLNVSYLRPATGNLRAAATVRRAGKSMAVIEVDVESELPTGERKTVALGRATYFIADDSP